MDEEDLVEAVAVLCIVGVGAVVNARASPSDICVCVHVCEWRGFAVLFVPGREMGSRLLGKKKHTGEVGWVLLFVYTTPLR